MIDPTLDFQASARELFDLVRAARAETDEEFPGVALVYGADGCVYTAAHLGSLPDSATRRTLLQHMLRQTGGTALAVIVECWMATTEPGTPRSSLPAYLGDAPGAVSTLLCIIETPEGSRAWSAVLGTSECREIQMSGGDLYGLLEWS